MVGEQLAVEGAERGVHCGDLHHHVGAIGVAVIIYGFAILLTKGITKKDFLMIPKGEKIAKVLEKIHLLR